MVLEVAFVSVFGAALAGLALSCAIERLMKPRPLLVRPWHAWALHCGIWLFSHSVLTLLLGRPWFAATAVCAFLLMVVLVNNAKMSALREPFVFQDYDYFTDTILHPRLYIPFLGWGKFLGCTAGFVLAISIGLWVEPAPALRFAWSGQAGATAVIFATGIVLLLTANRQPTPVSFEPDHDNRTFGLLASLWWYGKNQRTNPNVPSPFSTLIASNPSGDLPHLVGIQSESFFDPRPLFDGIRPQVLAEFDRLRDSANAHGQLRVPAWGANTVRTEFAFLSGVDENKLEAHRFNPYRAVAGGWQVPSVASFLKALGYRTICIHPYPVSFYQRNRVFPKLGFDEFLDIRAFDPSERFGPYIGDKAVGEKISGILKEATRPTFIFTITMENHGPLHLERVNPSDIDELYSSHPPADCEDLSIYLRHLRNADRMLSGVRETMEHIDQPASLCWFGDHVPIMPSVYAAFGEPNGEVPYVVWNNQGAKQTRKNSLEANSLSVTWLRESGLLVPAGQATDA